MKINLDPDETDEFDGMNRSLVTRAKWTMDGATTLSEAADRLDEFARYLKAMESDGWQLESPISDDYGHMIPVGEELRAFIEAFDYDEDPSVEIQSLPISVAAEAFRKRVAA